MAGDLVAFLAARLDEDQSVARAAAAKRGGGEWTAVLGDDGLTSVCGKGDGRSVPVILDPEDHETSLHVARHDPTRVLRGIEAKRRIVDWHGGQRNDKTPWGKPVVICHCGYDLPCSTLRLLASEYDGHSDYKEDWRP